MLLSKLTKEDLSYIAGIIDGRGNIHYRLSANSRKEYYPETMIRVMQTNKHNGQLVCEWLKNKLCGYLYQIKQSNSWKWEIRGHQVEQLVQLLKPYIVAKRHQILRIDNKEIENLSKFNFNGKFYTKI